MWVTGPHDRPPRHSDPLGGHASLHRIILLAEIIKVKNSKKNKRREKACGVKSEGHQAQASKSLPQGKHI